VLAVPRSIASRYATSAEYAAVAHLTVAAALPGWDRTRRAAPR
jgi:hypothetical protein